MKPLTRDEVRKRGAGKWYWLEDFEGKCEPIRVLKDWGVQHFWQPDYLFFHISDPWFEGAKFYPLEPPNDKN